ncbi:MAG: PKD repeat protein [Granulosicoccus sp.]|jgi:PKD repeat protein
MKRLLPLLSIFAFFALPEEAVAQSASCQNVTVQLDGTGNYTFDIPLTPQTDAEVINSDGASGGLNVRQYFTPTVSGLITSVSLNFASPGVTGTLFIVEDLGPLFHMETGIVSSGVGTPTVMEINASVELIAGTIYFIEFDGDAPYTIERDSQDPYPGGDSDLASETDLVFTVDILRRPLIDNGTTDSDGLASFGLSQTTFTCADAGTVVPVTLTATDNLGNSSSCVANVTVQDNVGPTPLCLVVTPPFALDITGNLTIIAADIDNGSNDACGILPFSIAPSAFTCADVGTPQIVTLTVTDNNSNSNSCMSTISIVDNTPPNAVCQNITVHLNAGGNAVAFVSDVDNGSSDECGLAAPSLNLSAFDCDDLGDNNVVLTITDNNGNTSNCNAVVSVVDTTSPVIICPGIVVQCGDDINGGVVTYSAPTATDNCTAVTVNQTAGLISGSLFPNGTSTITYVATDGSGNTDTCSFDVVIQAQPTAGFSHTSACLGEAVFFSDESEIHVSDTIVSRSWDMGDGSTAIGTVDPIHSYSAAGSYIVSLTVATASGCTETFTETVTVTEVPVANFTQNTVCSGDSTEFTNTSSIDPGYAGSLNYGWDFGDGNTSSAEHPTHMYATDGTYVISLTVSTDDGCLDMTSGSATVNSLPNAIGVVSAVCEGDSTQFTDLSIGSGLSWLWNFGDLNSSTNQNETYAYTASGSYTFSLKVTDSNGCSDSTMGSVVVNDLPTVAFSFTDSCEETSIAFSNGSDAGNYTWDFNDGNSSTLSNPSNTFLNSGAYNVTLSVSNANGCSDQLTQTINVFDNPEFTLTPSDVLCFEDSTGSILVSPTVGLAPLDFILDGGMPTAGSTFIDLFAGLHTVTIQDANGCSTSNSVIVDQPATALGLDVNSLTDILCHGDTSGLVDVTGTGGTGPYTYSINGDSQPGNGIFSGLMAGTHDLNITDSNDCMFDTTLTLIEPDTLVLLLDSLAHLMCNGDSSGWIDVAGIGGLMPYEYSIDGINFDSPDLFNTLFSGAHVVTVLDANGCTDTLNITLTEPGILMLSLLGTSDALCNAHSSGSISVAASSGTMPYHYTIDGGLSSQASGEFPGVGAGIYTAMVTDANGCSAETDTILISEPSAITIVTSSSPILCVGDSTGTLGIVADGGTPGYIYSIDEGDSFQLTSTYIDLPAGNYTVIVQDTLQCTASESVVIAQPNQALFGTALIQSILCFGDATGIIQTQASGGTGSYIYSIDAGANTQVTNTFENLAAGIYEISIEDINGCTFLVEAEVEGPLVPLEISDVIISAPTCPSESDGSIAIVANGGTAPYNYSSNGGNTFIESSLFTGAASGTYQLQLQDNFGCLDSLEITIVNPDSILLSIDNLQVVNCEGENNGLIQVSATGGTGPITFQLNGAAPQASGEFVNTGSGIHSVVAIDSIGCTALVMIDGTAINPLPLPSFTHFIAGETVAFTNTSSFGIAYSWGFGDGSPVSTDENPNHTYSSPGNYEVTLVVTNDCGISETTVSVSTVIFGIEDVEVLQGLSIYPNPSTGLVTLFFQSVEKIDRLKMNVYDLRGRSIHTKIMNSLIGENRIPINLIGFENGVYSLQVTTEKYTQAVRILIAK